MRQVVIGGSLVAALASLPLVGQARYLPDAPGRWKPWMFNAYGDVVRVLGAKSAEAVAPPVSSVWIDRHRCTASCRDGPAMGPRAERDCLAIHAGARIRRPAVSDLVTEMP